MIVVTVIYVTLKNLVWNKDKGVSIKLEELMCLGKITQDSQ